MFVNPECAIVAANALVTSGMRVEGGWIYREWAPAAHEMYLIGDFNGWDRWSHRLNNIGNGVFEIFIWGRETLWDDCRVKVIVKHWDRYLERIPSYCKRVLQNPYDYSWCGAIVDEPEYVWQKNNFKPQMPNVFSFFINNLS